MISFKSICLNEEIFICDRNIRLKRYETNKNESRHNNKASRITYFQRHTSVNRISSLRYINVLKIQVITPFIVFSNYSQVQYLEFGLM